MSTVTDDVIKVDSNGLHPQSLTKAFIYTGPNVPTTHTNKPCFLLNGDAVLGNDSKTGIHAVQVAPMNPINYVDDKPSAMSIATFLINREHLQPLENALKQPHPASTHIPAAE